MTTIEAHSTAKIRTKVTREEQAARELGRTEFEPGTRLALVVVFLVVVAAVPLVQFCDALRRPERISRLTDVLRRLAPPPEQFEAVDGVASAVNLLPAPAQIKAVEEEWEQNSVVGEALLPRVQSLLVALGQGNEKAYLGRDGWLFYRSDVDYVTGRGFLDPAVLRRRAKAGGAGGAPQPDPIQAIVRFRDQLAARGIELLVVPMPVKPSIYPECYSPHYTPESPVVENPSFGTLQERLAEAGVAVFDPAPLLAEAKAASPAMPLYLKTDTHWAPAAVELTAGKLAERVRGMVALPASSPGRFSAAEKTVENLGDVAMMLKLPAAQTAFPAETVRIRQVLDGKCLWRPDPKAQVLLLGDSFANIYSLEPMGWGEAAGLAEHLGRALGLPVDAICRNDAGAHATREMLAEELQRGNDRLTGKKVVIWEFAARELAFGNWKLLPLALGEKKTAEFYVPGPGRSVEVQGVVRAISGAPRPGTVPYKDHILMIHLVEIESADDPTAAGKQSAVLAWSMRDNRVTPAARYRPGDTIRLRLQPWSDVAAKYDAINRSGLDEDDLLLADPAWTGDVE